MIKSFEEFVTEGDYKKKMEEEMEGYKKVGEDEFQKVVTKHKAKSTSREKGGTDVVSYSADGKVVAKLVNPKGDGNATYYVADKM